MTRVILTDIEGTTSSIAFVKDVLFPHARRELAKFVHAHEREPLVREQLQSVRRELGEPEASSARVITTLEQWIDEDRKHGALKTLQGLIWEQGYRDGLYRSHMYADAVARLRELHAAGLTLAIYSSGSVAAQKLLFGHTDYGDLQPLFSAYFDTAVGPKRSVDSYRNIVEQLKVPASEVLFLSDVEEELDAAASAGLGTCWLVRPEDRNPSAEELARSRHPWARSFADISV